MFGRNNQNDNLFSDKNTEAENETQPSKPEAPKAAAPQPARPTPAVGNRPAMPRPSSSDTPMAGSRPITENKILTVGRDITLSGEIKRCDRLVIEGEVDATLEGTRVIEIAQAGIFNGDTEVEEADIAGTYSGTLTANKKLIIRKTGRVSGNIRYKEIIIEAGGQLGGDISFMDDN
ncbi:MAG: polymer-forming cytoskeletal protein [Alphaproteobacteria bacterium]